MTWYYVEDQQQRGPVTAAEFEHLVHSGRITPRTLVWREGMEVWQPLGSLNETAGASAPPEDHCPCVMCGRPFPTGDMLQFERAWVCAECKPLFVQKLREGGRVGSYGLWRFNNALVMARDAELPPRCVKCNAPTSDRMQRKLYWHPALVYLLLFIHVIVYLVVALMVRKQAVVDFAVCPEHRSKRRWAIATAWLLVGGGIGVIFAPMIQNSSYLLFVAGLLILAGVFYGVWKGRMVYASRIEKDHVWLNGVCPEFLDNLPEWDG